MRSILKLSMVFAIALLLLANCTSVQAAFVITGSLQTEQGDALDWDPPTSSLIMTESPAASGIFVYTASNLTPAGSQFDFKILDDEGTGPANWGDPELFGQNAWVLGDSDGSSTIRVDTNVLIGDGLAPHYKVGISNDAWTPQVVGDFMVQAGGANGDWNPQDPAFDMTPGIGGLWSYSATIAAAGSYQIKVSDGAVGWSRQFGSDGFSNNAGNFSFTTTVPNEVINATFTPATGDFVIPEPSTILLGLSGLLALAIRRRQ
jgi:hypothetical protein